VPATLEFAQFLANNASQNAAIYNDMCFTYSKESSNTLDSIAAQIQGIIGKVQSFLDSVRQYSTRAGIDQLEQTFMNFESRAVDEVERIVETRILALVNDSAPLIGNAVISATHQVGEQLGDLLGHLIGTPLGRALKEPLQSAMTNAVDSPQVGKLLGDHLSEDIGQMVANLSSSALANYTGHLLEGLVEDVLQAAGELLGNTTSDPALLQQPWRLGEEAGSWGSSLHSVPGALPLSSAARSFYGDRGVSKVAAPSLSERTSRSGLQSQGLGARSFQPAIVGGMSQAVTGAWSALSNILSTFTNLFPQAVNSLGFAKRDVVSLAFSLTTVFTTLEQNGPDIFDKFAAAWNTIWLIYLCIFFSLGLFLVYYAFWAGGYFGGPRPAEPGKVAEDPPQTWSEKFRVCCCACCACMTHAHDNAICFWSFITLAQVIVLVVFLVSIILSVFAGVKFFLISSCGQIYILNDSVVCGSSLLNLREFLTTVNFTSDQDHFRNERTQQGLQNVCERQDLLMCDKISSDLVSSTMLTCISSFLCTLFTLQFLVVVATMHEQARNRRLYNAEIEIAKDS
jgi:hypothetical protein